MFIDTHCHLSKDYYNDINLVIKENLQANINCIIISGCEKKCLKETLDIIKQYDSVYATIGYHPDQISKIDAEDIVFLEDCIKNNSKVIGIGEIGLDYYYDKTTREKQIDLFEEQLKLAEKLKLPVVIHSRDATLDTINVLKKYQVRGIIHCFSGSLETARQYIKMGYKLGIGGVVTFKNSKLYEVIEKIPLNDIVLETDSPYLAPEPYRGKTNSSKYIPIIAQKIADIKKASLEDVATITTKNCFDIFDLKL